VTLHDKRQLLNKTFGSAFANIDQFVNLFSGRETFDGAGESSGRVASYDQHGIGGQLIPAHKLVQTMEGAEGLNRQFLNTEGANCIFPEEKSKTWPLPSIQKKRLDVKRFCHNTDFWILEIENGVGLPFGTDENAYRLTPKNRLLLEEHSRYFLEIEFFITTIAISLFYKGTRFCEPFENLFVESASGKTSAIENKAYTGWSFGIEKKFPVEGVKLKHVFSPC
jgi:hypothetical protein